MSRALAPTRPSSPSRAEGGAATIRLRREKPRAQAPVAAREIQQWTFPGGEAWARFHRTRSGYLVRFPGWADFAISADGARVASRPVPGVSAGTIEHIFRNQVVPLALSRAGHLVIHASAVEIGGSALAFVGESGRGKSTLAAAFAAGGGAFIADDGLLLERRGEALWAVPGPDSLRLWPDSCRALLPRHRADAAPYSAKRHLRASPALAHRGEPLPLRRLYFLGAAAARISIRPLPPSVALIELVRHSFVIDVEDEGLLASQFAGLACIARDAACFRLDFPRRFGALEATRRAIARHAGD
jgi:hypothetical protein